MCLIVLSIFSQYLLLLKVMRFKQEVTKRVYPLKQIILYNTILISINDLNNDNIFFYFFITKAVIIYRLDINIHSIIIR